MRLPHLWFWWRRSKRFKLQIHNVRILHTAALYIRIRRFTYSCLSAHRWYILPNHCVVIATATLAMTSAIWLSSVSNIDPKYLKRHEFRVGCSPHLTFDKLSCIFVCLVRRASLTDVAVILWVLCSWYFSLFYALSGLVLCRNFCSRQCIDAPPATTLLFIVGYGLDLHRCFSLGLNQIESAQNCRMVSPQPSRSRRCPLSHYTPSTAPGTTSSERARRLCGCSLARIPRLWYHSCVDIWLDECACFFAFWICVGKNHTCARTCSLPVLLLAPWLLSSRVCVHAACRSWSYSPSCQPSPPMHLPELWAASSCPTRLFPLSPRHQGIQTLAAWGFCRTSLLCRFCLPGSTCCTSWSRARINSMGEIMSPCITPLTTLKVLE